MTDSKHLHGYGLEVKVNGQSGRLLLDTGATGLLINKKMAERAGIKPLTTTKIGGIGDSAETEGYVGYADSIKVGTLEFQNCLIEGSEKRSGPDDDAQVRADGSIASLRVLDLPNHKLSLQRL